VRSGRNLVATFRNRVRWFRRRHELNCTPSGSSFPRLLRFQTAVTRQVSHAPKCGVKEAESFLGGLEEQIDRKTTLQWVGSASFRILHEPSPSPRSGSGCEPIRPLSRGEALVSAMLLSLGLWALIWGAISLLAV
jgi:hypothetical protein